MVQPTNVIIILVIAVMAMSRAIIHHGEFY